MPALPPSLPKANTATCPRIVSVSVTVTKANSFLLVMEIASGSLFAGKIEGQGSVFRGP